MEMQAGGGWGACGYQLMVGINVKGGSEPAKQGARRASKGVQGTIFQEWKRGSSEEPGGEYPEKRGEATGA